MENFLIILLNLLNVSIIQWCIYPHRKYKTVLVSTSIGQTIRLSLSRSSLLLTVAKEILGFLPLGLALISIFDSKGLSSSSRIRLQLSSSVNNERNTLMKFSLICSKGLHKLFCRCLFYFLDSL